MPRPWTLGAISAYTRQLPDLFAHRAAALAQLYEQPVLIIDPGMHTAAIRTSIADHRPIAGTRSGGHNRAIRNLDNVPLRRASEAIASVVLSDFLCPAPYSGRLR
jgi:hypothetical protein